MRMRHSVLVLTLLVLLSAPARAEEEGAFTRIFNTEMEALKRQYGNVKLTGQQTAVITGSIACVVRKAGLFKTVGFYRDIKTVAEKTKLLCDAHMEAEAKDYVLSQYTPRKDDPLVTATLECYQLHAAALSSIIPDARKRGQLSSYYRWAKDPSLARSEMTGHEICH